MLTRRKRKCNMEKYENRGNLKFKIYEPHFIYEVAERQ